MENMVELVPLIISGALLLIIFILVIIFYAVIYSRKVREQEQKFKLLLQEKEMNQLRELFHLVEAERKTIAGDLQNETNTLLAALSFRIEKYRHLLKDGMLTEGHLQQDSETIADVMQQIHIASQSLSPMFLHRFGLSEAISACLDDKKNCDIKVKSDLSRDLNLNDKIITNAYRVIIDLVDILIENLGVKRIEVKIKSDYKEMLVSINYFEASRNSSSIEEVLDKTPNMQPRLIVLNSQLSVDNENSCVNLTIPLMKNE